MNGTWSDAQPCLPLPRHRSPAVGLMPVATLAGVIFSVAVHTMQWRNLTRLHRLPRHDAVIIVVSHLITSARAALLAPPVLPPRPHSGL